MGRKFISEVFWFMSCFSKDGGREEKNERSRHRAQQKKKKAKKNRVWSKPSGKLNTQKVKS